MFNPILKEVQGSVPYVTLLFIQISITFSFRGCILPTLVLEKCSIKDITYQFTCRYEPFLNGILTHQFRKKKLLSTKLKLRVLACHAGIKSVPEQQTTRRHMLLSM